MFATRFFQIDSSRFFAYHTVLIFSGRRPGSGTPDHILDARARDRFLQALYESGYLHYDQEAGETETRSFLIHGASLQRDLDVYHLRLPRSVRGAVPGLQIFPLRVADRGLRQWTHFY